MERGGTHSVAPPNLPLCRSLRRTDDIDVLFRPNRLALSSTQARAFACGRDAKRRHGNGSRAKSSQLFRYMLCSRSGGRRLAELEKQIEVGRAEMQIREGALDDLRVRPIVLLISAPLRLAPAAQSRSSRSIRCTERTGAFWLGCRGVLRGTVTRCALSCKRQSSLLAGLGK